MRNREDHLILIKVTWREQSTISSPQNTPLKILHIDFNVPFTLQNSLQNTIPAYKTHFLIPEVGVKLCLRPIHRTHCYSPNFFVLWKAVNIFRYSAIWRLGTHLAFNRFPAKLEATITEFLSESRYLDHPT